MAKLRQLDPNGITWHALSGYPRLENLATNPSFEATSGTVDIWKNLATNPSFEASSGTVEVRRNYALNPHGIGVSPNYSSGTITSNVPITGHPAGLTTAARVSYTNTDSNPGIAFHDSSSTNTQYTVSAWVYHESGGGTFGFAQKSIASGGPHEAVIGVWERKSWTFTTTTATNPFGYRHGSVPAVSGSFLITGMMIEKRQVLGDFFGGFTTATGDFTYSWVGTANASESVQNAPAVVSAPSRVGSVNYQSKTLGIVSGTKSIAVRSLGVNSDTAVAVGGESGSVFTTGLTAGKTYTVSATVTTPVAQTGSLSARARKILFFYQKPDLSYVEASSVAGPTTGTARVSVTLTIPSDAVGSIIRLYNGSGVYGETVYWDDITIVEGIYIGPYFDGSTSAQSDFTYAWLGTAHASESVQRAVKVVGPYAATNGGSIFHTYKHTDTDGSTVARYLVPKNVGTSLWRIAGVGAMSYQKIVKGRTYTLWVRYRGSTSLSSTTVGFGLMDLSTANKVLSLVSGVAIPTSWSVWSKTFVAENNGSAASHLYSLINNNNPAEDYTFDIAEWMLVEGHAPPAKYFDGSLPEDLGYIYSWTGTPDASTSLALPK